MLKEVIRKLIKLYERSRYEKTRVGYTKRNLDGVLDGFVESGILETYQRGNQNQNQSERI